MGQILICREALASNIISDIVLAMEAKKSGVEVGVLFTEEAVVALCQGVFDWPRQLSRQVLRLAMADNGAALGLPTVGGKGEARQLDVRRLVENAVEAGVPVYASDFWLKLSGLQDSLPRGIRTMDAASVVAALKRQNEAATGI